MIKLGTFVGKQKSKAFMDDLHATTSEHPFNPNMRIVNNSATVHISPNLDGSVHLHDIMSLHPRSGAGTEALQHLTNLADKHGVAISGTAKAYTDHQGRIGKSSRLKSWYQKHGFVAGKGNSNDGYPIKYTPKS